MNHREEKIVYLQGGLGNQLFQYALGLYLQSKTVCAVRFSTAFLGVKARHRTPRSLALGFLRQPENFIQPSSVRSYFQFYWMHLAHKFKLDRSLRIGWDSADESSGPLDFTRKHFIGYWQNLDFLSEMQPQITKSLKSNFQLSAEAQAIQRQIRSTTHSVSLHVRRGDYFTNPLAAKYYLPLGVDYYKASFEKISERHPGGTVFVFSDDLAWCRQNLSFLDRKIFVELKSSGPMDEIVLMSECESNIIANSSFSWWGAYLNEHPERTVITPQRWFHDPTARPPRIPEGWMTVSN